MLLFALPIVDCTPIVKLISDYMDEPGFRLLRNFEPSIAARLFWLVIRMTLKSNVRSLTGETLRHVI